MDSTKIKRHVHEEKLPCLPWELIEEILSHVCPKSLVRFRLVCKRWKALVDDNTFISNHKKTFQFILTTGTKIYSINIDPKIVVRDLTLDIPGKKPQNPITLDGCGEFLICGMDKDSAVWNPWLKQSTWINKPSFRDPSFKFRGIGYVSNRRIEGNVYKTIWSDSFLKFRDFWKIRDFSYGTGINVFEPSGSPILHSIIGVSLNGSLFWIASIGTLYHGLLKFDFLSKGFYRYCDMPCGMSHPRYALVLRVFKGDRFSVLKQCHLTKKIEIWVTKNKVNVKDGDDVVWMNLMTLSNPNFPRLVPNKSYYDQQPSYFIDDKRLVVCSCDETGRAWIYVMKEDKLISKVQLDSVVGPWPLHCTYTPNLVPVPLRPKRWSRRTS